MMKLIESGFCSADMVLFFLFSQVEPISIPLLSVDRSSFKLCSGNALQSGFGSLAGICAARSSTFSSSS